MITGYMFEEDETKEQRAVEVPLGATTTRAVGQFIVSPGGVEEELSNTPPAKLNVLLRPTRRETPVWPTLKLALTKLMVKSPTWTVPLAVWEAPPGEPTPVTNTR